MKVLQILPSLEVGGVERGVVDLVRAMKRRGEESVVISSGGSLVKELQKMGVPHYELPVHKKSITSLLLIPKIAEIIRTENVDIVHARSRVPAWIAYFAAKQTQVSFVTTCHGYYSNHGLSAIMGWGKRVIVISRVIARHMIDDFGVSPENIRLIHRGVDLSQFTTRDEVKDKRDISKRPFRIVNIGRFSPIKGQVEFLQAIHRLRQFEPHVEAWLVGSEGKGKTKYTELIRQTIRSLALENHVKLPGTRRDISELLKESDLLVLPTLVPEAFGRVIVEAGATGVPVIATRLGGVLDIIDHGENGLLVAPGDIHEMTEAMLQMIRSPEAAKKMAGNLETKVRTHFNLDQMVEKTLEVYREVRQEKKILVFKLGAMGDVILITPSLRMIKERFPTAKISLMVDKKFTSLVSNCPYLNEVIPVERERMTHLDYVLRLAKKIRREGYDLSVDFQNTKWTHGLAFLGGIERRYGFRRGAFGFLLNSGDEPSAAVELPVKNQCRILSKLGIHDFRESLELWSDPKTDEQISEKLKTFFPESSRLKVGLFVSASVRWQTKRWPLGHFRELAERLVKEQNCDVILLGGIEDKASVEYFFEHLPEGILNLVGQTTVRELMATIKQLNAIVTGDTAPLHMASAFQIKIIALFGPTDAKRHMPPGAGAIALQKNLPCQPCYKETCAYQDPFACMKQISVSEVLDHLRRQLAAGRVLTGEAR